MLQCAFITSLQYFGLFVLQLVVDFTLNHNNVIVISAQFQI